MSDVLVSVENVSKKFCRSLKRGMVYSALDVARDAVGVRGRRDGLRPEEFWAVRDVSFQLRQGECLGLIGCNGAGKSTLLKLLNGITRPDTGAVRVRGRVGALIEVGAGFHPMLTGRENIFINGAILGMSHREIARKFDSIVAFSGLAGTVLDAPVKTYSSGMYVRLGFSVAIHGEPEILLIDEVLAVGDATFQYRSRDRINELRRNGTSIVFVSHVLAFVNSLTTSTVVLHGGRVSFVGETPQAIGHYTSLLAEQSMLRDGRDSTAGCPVRVRDVRLNGQSRLIRVPFGERLRLEIDLHSPLEIRDGVLNVVFWSTDGAPVASYTSRTAGPGLLVVPEGEGELRCDLPEFRLAPGKYAVGLTISDEAVVTNYLLDELTILTVEPSRQVDSRYGWWVTPCRPAVTGRAAVVGRSR